MKRKILYICISSFLIFTAEKVLAIRFADDSDIPTWGVESVYTVQEEGIMTGFGDGTFQPLKSLNRAEALVILFRTKQIDFEAEDKSYPQKFSDVPAGAWFEKSVGEAVEQGWITGYPDGTFRPAQEVNRAEWAVLIMRAFGLEREEEIDFQDVPSQAWFSTAIRTLSANELIREKSISYGPDEPVIRADAAWVMAHILAKPRLSGESQGFTEYSEALRRDTRRVAIKPRDFDPNQQGYDIESKELNLNVIPREDSITVRPDSGWIEMGQLVLKDTLDDRVELHSLEFKLVFDQTDVGPTDSFVFRMKGEGVEIEQDVGQSGNIFIAGIDLVIQSGEELVLDISLKPKEDAYYYGSEGTGKLFLFQASASMISTFLKENSDRNGGYRFAPLEFVDRNFTPITFKPNR